MEYLTSMSSADFFMAQMANQLSAKDSFYNKFAGKQYRGNMTTVTVRTFKGHTIMIQHDVTSPRPYSRSHLVSGTKGIICKYPEPDRISKNVYDAALWSSIAPLREKSVANLSNSVDVPDFSFGALEINAPFELALKGGGITGVKTTNKM